MTVSGITTSPLLTESEQASGQQIPAAVALLKKAQDQMKLEGEALVRMIEQSAPTDLRRLDAYA
jgi:hypothetical protein